MKKYRISLLICLGIWSGFVFTQSIDTEHISFPYAEQSIPQLRELLGIPNDAHYPADIEKNVSWCSEKLAGYGFETQRLETETVPLLLGVHSNKIADAPTVLFYFHIDGQPVDPTKWFQKSPYQAVLKQAKDDDWEIIPWAHLKTEALDPEWRIYARSSSDDKGPFVMLLAALETLREQGKSLPYNLKIILDFEEEIGSPHLAQAVKVYQEALSADMLLIFDGPKHMSNQPTIAYGARGITTLTLEVFGPSFSLHSGHYGNYAPNPALRLSQLLSSMKDERGRVIIPGYYDGIELDADTKAILSSVPDDEKRIMNTLGIGEMDMVGNNYQESIQYPSLNVRGLSAGWVGKEVRTIVPASAIAEIDLRLVVESDGERLLGLIKKHIEEQGYYVIDRQPTQAEREQYPKICRFGSRGRITPAFRTDFDSDLGLWVYTTIQDAFDTDPIRLRTMGGTLPTSHFINTLNVPALIVPLVNSDNNQHSPNENLRLGNYFDGVKTIYEFLNTAF